MLRRTLPWLLLLLALLLLVGSHIYSQDSVVDVSGQWIGIFEWDELPENWIEPNVRIYRLNILQDGRELRATHIVQGDEPGEDLIVTRPVSRFDEPLDYGFGGTLEGATLRFNDVSVYMGHCDVDITLEYLTAGDDAVLVGHVIPTVHVIPTPVYTLTPTEAASAPDAVVGCQPPTGAVVLRRFGPLPDVEN